MSEDRSVTALVTRARSGDKRAWDDLVERYAPLMWSICRSHQLSTADADDVHQSVWLQLVRQLDRIREPTALPGWLVTTTRRECGRVRRAARESDVGGYVPDAETIPDRAPTVEQELLVAERHAALREALGRLSPCCQRLIGMLIEDPPPSYAQISASLSIPVGSVGPRRGRCLEKLRGDPVIAALIDGYGCELVPIRSAQGGT